METRRQGAKESFGQCLRSILQEKGISASEASRLMGMKSRNAIFRILADEGSDMARSAFCERFCTSLADRLGEEDKARLVQALEPEDTQSLCQNRAMRMLLSGETIEEAPVRLLRQAKHPDALPELLESYVTGESLCVTMLGCCCRTLFEQLARALEKADLQCDMLIEHYIYAGEGEITGNLYAIRPLLGDPRYKVYCIEPGRLSPPKERIYRNNIAGISARGRDGRERHDYLMQIDESVLHLIECREGSSHRRMRRLLQGDRERMQPLASSLALPRTAEDCLVYAETRRVLEYERELFFMRRTLPAALVPADIFASLFRAAFERAGVGKERIDTLCAQLETLQHRRWQNVFFKKQPTHVIVTRDGLQTLARTGEHADLRYPAGPYRPEERLRILRHLREQAAGNPQFHLHVFKEGFEPNGMEIGLCGEQGALLSRPQSVSDELLITVPTFLNCYRAYLKRDLLRRQVLSQRDTIQLLDALIDQATACG